MLYLCYPDIPWRATRTASSGTWLTDQPYINTVFSERYHYAQTSTAAWNIEYDLGVGVTAPVNYLIVAKAAALKASGTANLLLESGSAGIGGAYTTQQTIAFNSATLIGPGADDYLLSGINLAAARSWRVRFSAFGANAVFSKIYFGSVFDFGKNPDTFSFERVQPDQPIWTAESGSRDLVRQADFLYRFTFNFTGLTDLVIRNFYDQIVEMAHFHRFFLYTTSYHAPLNGLQLVHCKLLEHSTDNATGVNNQNSLAVTFEQVLG